MGAFCSGKAKEKKNTGGADEKGNSKEQANNNQPGTGGNNNELANNEQNQYSERVMQNYEKPDVESEDVEPFNVIAS